MSVHGGFSVRSINPGWDKCVGGGGGGGAKQGGAVGLRVGRGGEEFRVQQPQRLVLIWSSRCCSCTA